MSIQYGQVILKAILRVEARIGIAFETFLSSLETDVLGPIKAGAGVEARIYANVAEFITNITLNEVDSLTKRDDGDTDDDNCQLSIAQGFTFGIGAAAGASVELLGNTWGPSPETEIPIFYTTLAAACITSKSSAPTTMVTTTATTAASTHSSAPGKRADSPSITSTVTTETQSATICLSSSLINCPASLQSITRNVVTKTLTSTITPGVSVWSTGPASTFQTVDFQDDAVTMTSSSGKPKSYTPPPPPPPPTSTSSPTGSATGEPSTEEKSGKHRVSNAVIIGVSVGLGVPVLLAVLGAFM